MKIPATAPIFLEVLHAARRLARNERLKLAQILIDSATLPSPVSNLAPDDDVFVIQEEQSWADNSYNDSDNASPDLRARLERCGRDHDIFQIDRPRTPYLPRTCYHETIDCPSLRAFFCYRSLQK